MVLKKRHSLRRKNLYLLGTNQLVIFEFSQLWTQGNVTVNQEWFPAFLVKFLKWDSWNQITEEWVFLLFFFFWFIKNGQYSEPPGLTSDPLGGQSDCINPSCSFSRQSDSRHTWNPDTLKHFLVLCINKISFTNLNKGSKKNKKKKNLNYDTMAPQIESQVETLNDFIRVLSAGHIYDMQQ